MDEKDSQVSFSSMGLDDRLLKALSKLNWIHPTLVQQKFIPLALEGKDVLTRARTGSGKTGAFAIPIIQKILERKALSGTQHIRVLVLVPTKELANQVTDHMRQLSSACSKDVRTCNLCSCGDYNAQKALLAEVPDVLVSTPSKVLRHLKSGPLDFQNSLEYLVIDEADLLFSFGFEADVRGILEYLPESYQSFLTSATLNNDVKTLKKLVLHNPATLKLEEAQLPSSSQLTQYQIKCSEEDKFVLIYALLKLRLVRGKTIMFVNETNRCYKLKLFLEQFGIPTCVLNSEMPVNSRCHVVHQFNEGVYDYVVATDEKSLDPAENKDDRSAEAQASFGKKFPKKRKRFDKESGVSRGIDFHHVSNVVNFDFPASVDDYIHRVGRTARGWNRGTALSFATDADSSLLEEVEGVLNEQMGSEVLKPYQFRMEELDGFRYRARDVLNAVTGAAVRSARLAEIREEIVRSKRLKSYFAKNPRDIEALNHDKALRTMKTHSHLKDVPEYIVPPTLRGLNYSAPFRTKRSGTDKFAKPHRPPTRSQRKYMKKKSDPLISFIDT